MLIQLGGTWLPLTAFAVPRSDLMVIISPFLGGRPTLPGGSFSEKCESLGDRWHEARTESRKPHGSTQPITELVELSVVKTQQLPSFSVCHMSPCPLIGNWRSQSDISHGMK